MKATRISLIILGALTLWVGNLSAATDADFYENNLGCFKMASIRPSDGNGYWIVKGQGTEDGHDGSREIKVIPLNRTVASALQSYKTPPGKYLCLGGSSIGGPNNGKGPNTYYAFSAHWM